MTWRAGGRAEDQSLGPHLAHLPAQPLQAHLPPPPSTAPRRATPAGRTCALLGGGSLGFGVFVFSMWQSAVNDTTRNENELPMEAVLAWMAGAGSVGLAALTIFFALLALGTAAGANARAVAAGLVMAAIGVATSVALIVYS